MKLAIIPARGGSKRIPRKNIQLFAGIPMISYAIAVAKESEIFDAIVVTSDDQEILELAESAKVKIIKRPQGLADDYTSTVSVIAHAIRECETWGWQSDQVCCIYPAVPFLQAKLLVKALNILDSTDIDYIFPIAAFESPIDRALYLSQEGKVRSFNENYEKRRTQDIPLAYYDAGQFYWGRKSAWLAEKSIHANSHGIIIPSLTAIDIDTIEDWHKAELLWEILTIKGSNYVTSRV